MACGKPSQPFKNLQNSGEIMFVNEASCFISINYVVLSLIKFASSKKSDRVCFFKIFKIDDRNLWILNFTFTEE